MDKKLFCRRFVPVVSLILLLFCGHAHGAPIVSATDRASLQKDSNGDGKVNRGDTVRHTITIGNSGDSEAANTLFTEIIDPGTTLVPGSMKTTPAALGDSYNAVGNVRIKVPAADGVLKNDFGIPAPTATVVSDGISANGGNVTIDADGGFTYNPPAGFTGEDTFTYTAVNGQGSDTGTVTVTVGGMIWFVNASAEAGGDGRLTSPFNCLVGPACYSASTKKASGDSIFLYPGNYAGGFTLLNNQMLVGQGASASLAAIAGLTPPSYSDPLPDTGGTRPNITISGLILGTGNTLRGFDISVTGSAIAGANIGAFTAGDMTVNASGSALILANGTANTAFTFLSSGGGTNNVSLSGVNGSIAIGGGSWSSAAGPSLLVSGGNVSLTYSGNITQSSNFLLAEVKNGHNGTLTFSGTLSATSGAGLKFENSDGSYNFNGTTSLRGGAGIDISAGTDTVNGSQGVFNFGAGTSIVDRAGSPFSMTGSRAQVTYSGSISQAVPGQPLVSVSNDAGTLTFNSGTLSATTGTGLQFSNADGSYSFNGTTTLNGGDAGIDIVSGSDGNFTFASSTSITNPSGPALYINGGGGAIAYNGAVSKSSAGRLIDIQSRSGGSLALSGNLTCSGSCTGVYIKNTALAGTLSITGPNNTLSTTNATALHVENTTITAAGLAFKSISANGGDYGIYLYNTGTTGGLTVSGDNGLIANGSGGIIQNIARRGASFTNAAKISLARMNFTTVGTGNSWNECGALGAGSNNGCNAGIHLQGVTDATLNYLTMNGGAQQGINGSSVTNFQLSNSTVKNFGDQAGEDGVRVLNLLGTSGISNSTISDNRSRQVNIKNAAATSLSFSMNSCTLENNLTSDAWKDGEYLMQFSAQNTANMTGNVQGSTFRNNRALAGGFQSNSVGASAMNITINNSTFTSLSSASIDIVQAGSANVAFNVTNNTLTGNAQGNLINIYRAGSSLSNKTLSGKILNNTLIGSSAGSGISVSSLGMGTTTVLVDNNSVSGITQHGIYVSLQEDSSGLNTVNATVSNNRITSYSNATVGFHGIMVQAGTQPDPSDKGSLCASISGNSSVNGPNFDPSFPDSSSNHALRVRQRYLTDFRMPGYGGTNNDNAAVVSFIRGKNPATIDWVSATNNVSGGGGGFLNTTAGTPCALPQ